MGLRWIMAVLAAIALLNILRGTARRSEPTPPPDMVYVPPGPFLMGSQEKEMSWALGLCLKRLGNCPPDTFADEEPQRQVYLDGFFMDRHEVTNTQYRACVAAGKCRLPFILYSRSHDPYYADPRYDDYPVIYVSWQDAADYCHWAGKRLPTEAEWEKAARGSDGRRWPWGNHWHPHRANTWQAGPHDTSRVGSYSQGRSPYGALDMAGNVWEWVADWYAPDYYAWGPVRNPSGPTEGQLKVLRGGSWISDEHYARCAYRLDRPPDYRTANFGFRCARDLLPRQ